MRPAVPSSIVRFSWASRWHGRALAATLAMLVAWSMGAQQPTASADSARLASVSGTVYDSVSAAPLAGAEVQLIDAANPAMAYSGAADSSGHFLIAGIAPGEYIAGFLSPAVDALGIQLPLTRITLGPGQAATLPLATPSGSRIARAVCGPPTSAADSTGAMAGIVRDADSGQPLPGATVLITWNEIVIDQHGMHAERRRVPVRTREDGTYTVCDLAAGDDVIASAELGSRHTGLLQVAIPVRSLVHRDFALGSASTAVAVRADSADAARASALPTLLRGTARLAGTVHAPDGHPVNGAKVFVWGTGQTGETDADGRFAIAGLPAGSFSVEARALGFVPVLSSVDLGSDRVSRVALRFAERPAQLAGITVYGKRPALDRHLSEFLDRKAHNGFGHFLTASDIAQRNPFLVTDALRAVPGIRVVPGQGFGNVVLGRGDCAPAVYVDGVPLRDPTQIAHMTGGGPPPRDGSEDLDEWVTPEQVAGIEVYSGVAGAPVQYNSNACGLILVWTK